MLFSMFIYYTAYCPKLLAGAKKRVIEQKSLEEIGNELCPNVKDPRGKAKRIVELVFGKPYLKKHAVRLGIDYSHNRNPNGNNRPKQIGQMTEKEKQVEKIKHLIEKNGYQADLFDVSSFVDEKLTPEENLEIVEKEFPSVIPHTRKWHETEPTTSEQVKSIVEYEELLDVLDIAVGLVRKRNINGWQCIEDIVNMHLDLDESVWDYKPMEIYITPEPEEMME